ncbi:MAG: IniB N-terminal domain-containing protein [Pseudonocardiaceae bacterium]
MSVSSLIDFLMNLLRDEAARTEFMEDPQGTLARNGLDGLCGQDVRDVQPILADHAAVHVKHGGYDSSRYHDDDPVREISHITEHYEVRNVVVNDSDEYNFTYVDDRDTIVNVDDRDTTAIHADGDVTIEDSFNQDNDVNVIEDSFNQDNDGVDNKGGTIEDSPVAGDDIEDSLNSDDDVAIDASDDDVVVDASDDDTTQTSVEDSFNSTDDDGVDVDLTEEAAADSSAA